MAQTAGPHFRTIGLRQGLSNSQVGCFLKDSRGYVWFGTLSGLDRFDGFRFKNFYSTSDTLSLLSDYITRLEEDVNGDIWVETMAGYCLYHPATESFDRNMGAWMKARGMEGIPNRVLVDSKKQLWIAVNGRGVYTLKEGSKGSKARLFPVGQQHVFTDICETPKGVAVIDDHGVIITIMPDSSPQGGKVQVNNYLPKHAAPPPVLHQSSGSHPLSNGFPPKAFIMKGVDYSCLTWLKTIKVICGWPRIMPVC